MIGGEKPFAFAPGAHAIVAHGGFAFAFAGMQHRGSILATPRGVRPLDARTVEEIDERALAAVFAEIAEAPRSIEFLVVGAGERPARLRADVQAALRRVGIRFEAMATGPALRVYNVMQAEDRRVAAALIAAP